MGHSLAVVTLQAGVAEHLLETRPEEARQAIAAIRQISRKALGELRYELAMLRGEGRDGPSRAPTPALRDLGGPVASVRGGDAGGRERPSVGEAAIAEQTRRFKDIPLGEAR